MWQQVWRFLYRDWRAGELSLLGLALLICIASITTVNFFTDRVNKAITQQSSELLAADFVITSAQTIAAERETLAKNLNLTTTDMALFRSVIAAGDAVQMVEVKVVEAGYPLRGELLISDTAFGQAYQAQGQPKAGDIWVEPRLLQALDLQAGQPIKLGAKLFTIRHIIEYEPDRGGDFFRMAPRVMINQQDLAATELIQVGSRVNYRLLVAGQPEQVALFSQQVKQASLPGETFLAVKDGRPEIRFAFERADFFLNIVALMSVLLGSIAIAMAAQRYTRRHIDTVAILRTMGLTQNKLFLLFLLEMMVFAIVVSLLGSFIGYSAQFLLAEIMSALIVTDLPSPGFSPVIVGTVTGFIVLLGFVMPPIWLLKQAPPIRVLRRDQAVSLFNKSFVVVFIGAIFVLWIWRLGEGNVAQYILLGTIGTILTLYLAARLLVYILKPTRGLIGVSWRYGLANLTRRANLSSLQITAFGLGIMLILLSSLIRTELLTGWQQSMPADTPNYFLVNIQKQQLDGIRGFLNQQQVAVPEFSPMTRGRLLQVNGQDVDPANYENPRAKRLILNEFNLSWRENLPESNIILTGRWWEEHEKGQHYISLDPQVAESLKLKLGDKLLFNVAGNELELTLLNTRGINWGTFQVNFFALLPHGLLEDLPSNWVASMHLAEEKSSVMVGLVKAFPNITVIDIDVVISRIRGLMDRIAAAIEYMLGFTLLIALIIMLTAMQATQDERRHEAALLQTLGAPRKWILKSVLAEFAALGLVAGGIAGIAASLTGWVLAEKVFKFDYTVSLSPILIGMLAGAVTISLIGWFGTQRVLKQPPIDTFRRA